MWDKIRNQKKKKKLNRLALSKSDVAVAEPLEYTLGEEFLGCSFLIVALLSIVVVSSSIVVVR